MIDFGASVFVALAAFVVAMAAAYLWLARWRRNARAAFAGPQAARWPAASFWPRTLLVLAAASLIVFATMRPQWGHRELSRERQGIDVVIVLDISDSMNANDAPPTRLGLAQSEITRLVDAERGNRFGVVFFAGSAVLRSPLTTDTSAVSEIIRRADRESGLARVGSDLGAALDVASTILQGSPNSGKAIIVVSDGEDFGGTYAEKADALRGQGVTIFSAGVGTVNGAPLFDTDRSGRVLPKLDRSGVQVVSRLNEATLQQVAGSRDRYERLSAGASLSDFRDDLDSLQRTPIADDLQKLPVERFQYFAAVAFALLLASWLVPSRVWLPRVRALRLRPHPAIALVLVALIVGACGGSGDATSKRNAEANRLYNQQDYEGALAIYQQLLADRPDIPELSYNAGNTLHRLGDFDRAVDETRRALPPTTASLGDATYYALGNHLLQLQRYEEAFDAYRNALLINPSDFDAKYNLELTLTLLTNEQQPPDPQGDQGDQPAEGDGDQQPGDAQGSPQPGGTAQPSGTPAPGVIARDLQDALKGIDDDLTFEEAVHILDLFREGQAQQGGSQQDFQPGADY